VASHFRWLCLSAAVCAAVTVAACDNASPDAAGGVRYRAQKAPFIIGVWSQPSYSFAKWRARGINTVVSFESLSGTVPYGDWRAELERQNLYAIRQPQGALAQDARDPRLLAWMHPDEPDITSNNVAPALLQRQYKRWKKAARGLPVFLNLCGPCVMQGNSRESRYRAWISAADWVSNDFYPVTGNGRPDWIDLSRDPQPRMGLVLDRLASWSHKPQIEIVEASNLGYGRNPRAATPAELRGMVWHSIIHGASGIVYFPQRIGGRFKFDAAPANIVAEMKRLNRSIARLAPVLLSRGKRTRAPKPFERAVRNHRGRRYRIVLNLSHQAARFHGRRYRAYEVRISSRRVGRSHV
jgi:hypothetical protein